MIQIHEMHKAISGEVGTFIPQGTLCFLIRAQGCNLQCPFCDTPQTQSTEGGKEYTVDDLVKAAALWKLPVLLTGGEPLMQGEMFSFLVNCDSLGIKVQVETNGTVDPTPLAIFNNISFIMDVKPDDLQSVAPTSDILNLREFDWLKFMVNDESELIHALRTIKVLKASGAVCRFAVSPTARVRYEALANAIILCGEEVTFNLQIHKIINTK